MQSGALKPNKILQGSALNPNDDMTGNITYDLLLFIQQIYFL
jgi:hypothetical protein